MLSPAFARLRLREKVFCRPREGQIALAPSPEGRVKEGAMPGPNILSALVVNKTVDGLPLHRTRRRFKRAGVNLPIQTLNRWEGFAHELLLPLVERIKTYVKDADVINTDDTGLQVRDPSLPKGVRSGHIWVFIGRKFSPDGDLSKTKEWVFFLCAPSWSADYPEEFLKDTKAALQGDAYRGYERIAAAEKPDAIPKLLAGCAMHARRPFVQAFEAKDPTSIFFVENFQKIYQVEALAKKENLTIDARFALRKEKSLPLMEAMKEQAEKLETSPLLKPMRQGVTYFQNQWDKLIVPFNQDGRMDIDNGLAERRLRRVATGRKAWLFAGAESGAIRHADLLSIVASAEAAHCEPGEYLPSILPIISDWPNRKLDELLPLSWKKMREETDEEQIDSS